MRRTIAPQCPVNPEEHILRQVLGLRSVSREPVANIKYAPRVSAHKFLPGRPVALEALLDQLGVLLQRIVSLICLLRCKACQRVGHSLRGQPAVHLGLPTMERKLPSKCSRVVRSVLRPLCSASYSAIHLETRKSIRYASLDDLARRQPPPNPA